MSRKAKSIFVWGLKEKGKIMTDAYGDIIHCDTEKQMIDDRVGAEEVIRLEIREVPRKKRG